MLKTTDMISKGTNVKFAEPCDSPRDAGSWRALRGMTAELARSLVAVGRRCSVRDGRGERSGLAVCYIDDIAPNGEPRRQWMICNMGATGWPALQGLDLTPYPDQLIAAMMRMIRENWSYFADRRLT